MEEVAVNLQQMPVSEPKQSTGEQKMSLVEESDAKAKITLNAPRSSKLSMVDTNIYTKSLLNKNIALSISQIGSNIKEVLEEIIMNEIEGKCIVEGYVKPNSVKVINYSSGIVKGENIVFDVKFECLVCFPVEGMELTCVVKDVTKAGIRALSETEPSPFIVFVARDHNNMKKDLNKD